MITLSHIRKISTIVIAIVVTALSGCGSLSVSVYKDEKPKLTIEEYFSGDLEAIGIVSDRSGRVLKRFVCAMKGSWNGNELILDEDFQWSDNTHQKRVWRLTKTSPNTFVGTAGDVVGEAQVEVAGNAMHLVYTLEVPMDGSTTRLHVDDWLYLVTDTAMINHSKLTKFGLDAAEVVLSIRKISPL
jgi:hypothetical protein